MNCKCIFRGNCETKVRKTQTFYFKPLLPEIYTYVACPGCWGKRSQPTWNHWHTPVLFSM